MNKGTNNFFGNFIAKVALCAAYLGTLLLTKNASVAAALYCKR